MKNRLEGKIALITGASSGIGMATAIALAKEGVNLILLARRKKILDELEHELREKYSVDVLSLNLDVRNKEEVQKKINELPSNWKAIDILVNNAGLAVGTEKVFEYDMENVDKMIDTNVKGIIYVSKAVIPLMLKLGRVCSIINVGSVAGDFAYAGGSIYCASKAAVKALSDGMRIDLIDTPIRVTNVKPGLVETEFSIIRFYGDVEKAKNVYKGIDALTGEDIAQTITYICNLPDNVQIPEITMTPLHQATVRDVYKDI